MDNIYEIKMDDLKKEIQKYPIGTSLVCENDGKIYMHLCTSESSEKPVWSQLLFDYELERRITAIKTMSKTMSTVEKVKWFRSQFGSLPNGTDIMSLPSGYYKSEESVENEINCINQIIIESVIHGADSGGSYDSNENNLIKSLNNWLELKNLKAKYEVKEVEVHIRRQLWFILQIVKK